jgi:FkbM family methyltransferase
MLMPILVVLALIPLVSQIKKLRFVPSEEFVSTTNPLDGKSPLLWLDTTFAKRNYPGLAYDLAEKRQIWEMAKRLPLGKGVVDVGAHIGDLALPLSHALLLAGRKDVAVYAIDPSVEKFDYMQRVKEANDLENLTVLNYGLSNVCTTGSRLAHGKSNHNTGSYRWAVGGDQVTRGATELCEMVTLNKLQEDGLVGRVGLYHIDVEGHELVALQGSSDCLRNDKPVICLESWRETKLLHKQLKILKVSKRRHYPELFDYMQQAGYSLDGLMANRDMRWTCVAA